MRSCTELQCGVRDQGCVTARPNGRLAPSPKPLLKRSTQQADIPLCPLSVRGAGHGGRADGSGSLQHPLAPRFEGAGEPPVPPRVPLKCQSATSSGS